MTAIRTNRPRPSGHRTASQRRGSMRWQTRAIVFTVAAVLVLFAMGTVVRQFAPTSNTSLSRFDAIVVLGASVDSDGNPTPELLQRVTEGVHEYERGTAPRLILSGGATTYGFAEANVMARTAQAMGIPASAIVLEEESQNTIQNACYTERIMKAHGWQSAEVVSSASHLPRAGIIFNRLPLRWSAHAAPPLQPESSASMNAAAASEILHTVRYLVWARWTNSCGAVPTLGRKARSASESSCGAHMNPER